MVTRDVPQVLRNTIGAQTTVRGVEPILVSGYGLVVGLNGTGSADVPGPVRAVMEREMTALGVGRGAGPFQSVSPSELLASRDTAVVIVSAVIPPGAPVGTRFDVLVEALPGTSTSSLEGGRLYTTRLYRGLVRPDAPATAVLAEASGELFINPFADPASSASEGAPRAGGRVLNGGAIKEASRVMLALDNPSHTRSRAMADAINSRFRQPGQPTVAFGLSEDLVAITIPTSYRDQIDEFVSLLRRTRVDQSFPEQAALTFSRALREFPELSDELAWSLQALGPIAIPHLRGLYDAVDERPRLAAMEAGARLGDLLVRPHLERLAVEGPPGLRPRAVRLLARLGEDPKISTFLRDQLDSPEVDVRIAAYEALERRGAPWVERRTVGKKFVVDAVPSAHPMIYVTLQKTPRIVLFGEALAVRRPVFVGAWNDRLMVSARDATEHVSVYYRDHRTGQASTSEVPATLGDFIEYLAHRTTPEEPAPGLDLSYSAVVGAMSQIVERGGVPAVFVPETDRLALELIRSRQIDQDAERPELASEDAADAPGAAEPDPSPALASDGEDEGDSVPPVAEGPAPTDAGAPESSPAAAPRPGKRRYVVPVAPPPGAAKPAEPSAAPR